jgi:diketogulonate reductase-like aldo/keto reductase
MAWVLARGDDIVPSTGIRRRSYLDENIGAFGLALKADELHRLDAAFQVGAVSRRRDAGPEWVENISSWLSADDSVTGLEPQPRRHFEASA